MTNTLPTYVGVSSNHTSGVNSNTLVTTGLTLVPGDLLIAVFYESDTTSGNTWTSAWQPIATAIINSIKPLQAAYTYVGVDGTVTAPTFSTAGSSATNQGKIYQFRNARIATPIGDNQSGASDSINPGVCNAVVATAGNSLAFVAEIGSGSALSWPPAGWTQADNTNFSTAYKTLVNAADSSGALSIAFAGATQVRILNIEILGALPMVSDYYFNGLPAQVPL